MRTLPMLLLAGLLVSMAQGAENPHRSALKLQRDDALATGNEWISLPEIRVSDGALVSFNALSMRERGLLQVNGEAGRPALAPYVQAGGKSVALDHLAWELLDYWIPEAHQEVDGLEVRLTWCAPIGYRAAFLRLQISNRRSETVPVALGLRASFGALSRVTYVPVALRGSRAVGPTPWVDPGEAFSYITDDTRFSWAVVHPGSVAQVNQPPLSVSPEIDAVHKAELKPGESTEALYVLAVGVEEFSSAHNARSLREMLDRNGAEAMIDETAAWSRARARHTGREDLDLLMNRNLLFTAFYAWGRTIDTEQLVGVTSRSPRYYVSAAYWDRDAMLWSFPGLLDFDHAIARDALDYALGIQLRNTGTHSRFIDGVVLEDGFQLDEAVAPVLALASYVRATGDLAFLQSHRDAVQFLRDRLYGRYDAATGLYSSLQDSQDEFQKLPFITYDNALSWRALNDLSYLYQRLNDSRTSADLARRARELHAAVLKYCVIADAPGADGPMFASATDGKKQVTTDIPPGSLMKLPTLGFIAEDDPLFQRTYRWLHSPNYAWSWSTKPYGLPGSYRLPITTAWTIADEMLLKHSREKAESILLASPWDAGIVSEGIDPETAHMDFAGRAFATSAGYVAHAICQIHCQEK